ncbi:hypothetical protein GC194_03565 [bacterium]|nr:hypothetical protein [bacterium]
MKKSVFVLLFLWLACAECSLYAQQAFVSAFSFGYYNQKLTMQLPAYAAFSKAMPFSAQLPDAQIYQATSNRANLRQSGVALQLELQPNGASGSKNHHFELGFRNGFVKLNTYSPNFNKNQIYSLSPQMADTPAHYPQYHLMLKANYFGLSFAWKYDLFKRDNLIISAGLQCNADVPVSNKLYVKPSINADTDTNNLVIIDHDNYLKNKMNLQFCPLLQAAIKVQENTFIHIIYRKGYYHFKMDDVKLNGLSTTIEIGLKFIL